MGDKSKLVAFSNTMSHTGYRVVPEWPWAAQWQGTTVFCSLQNFEPSCGICFAVKWARPGFLQKLSNFQKFTSQQIY